MPFVKDLRATVACDTSMPSFCNSPWIRGAPHITLAAHIFRIDLKSLGLYQVFPVGTDGPSMSNKA
jgi:hypothetical protein